MPMADSALSGRVADQIMEMITLEKRFAPGDKLPNELLLSQEMGVSRTTLREAIRVLVTRGVLEIRRGRGTFVVNGMRLDERFHVEQMANVWLNVKDLYEMRLIFEPQAAYYAAKRATDQEVETILEYGRQDEERMLRGEDSTRMEKAFHNGIARASHNEFIHRLLPMLSSAIHKGVILANDAPQTLRDSIQDHRYIMQYLKARNAAGARTAMELHIMNTMRGFGIELD